MDVQVWVLVCIHGLMIYNGRVYVALVDLTVGQVEVLTAVLGMQWLSTAATQEWAGLADKGDGWW